MSSNFRFDPETRRQILASKAFQPEAFAARDRLTAFERYVYGESTGFLGQPRLVSLSASNENYNKFRRMSGDKIRVSDTITSGYAVRAQAGPESDPHDNVYVSLCLSGSGHIQTEFEEQQIHEGDGYINLSRNYRLRFGAGESRRVVFPKQLLRGLDLSKEDILILRRDDPAARLVRSTADAVALALASRNHDRINFVRDLMVSISERIIDSTLCDQARWGHKHIRDRAVSYIKENLRRSDLTISEIAKYVNVSRATLYRVFDDFGGLKEFIVSERIDAARSKLRTGRTDRSIITSIAYDTGFSSPEQFSKVFKARTGMSPTRFVRSGLT